MANSRQKAERPKLTVSHAEADAQILDLISEGEAAPNASVNESREAREWYEYATEALRQLCTTDELADDFTGRGSFAFGDADISTRAYLDKLRSIRRRVSLLPSEVSDDTGATSHRSSAAVREGSPTKVFLVHGHDEGARESAARFLERLGLQVVILHEQPNEGRTLIEKLEAHGDVDYALVLLTPDDVGAVAREPDRLTPRARQNVILELGFFFGRLERRRVCALYKSGVELPSDYQGIVYVPMDDDGAWRLIVGRELRQAGFQVDLNKIA